MAQLIFAGLLLGAYFQMKLGENKTVLVYNRINNYILDALLKAVFRNDH